MNPNEIELKNLSKSFEYTKLAAEIDECNDINNLKNLAKSFCKLYFKQQETMSVVRANY